MDLVGSGYAKVRCANVNIRLMKIKASLKLKMDRWCLNPPVSLEKVQALEARYGFRLPNEYRDFITQIGNGGKMPPIDPRVDAEPCQLLPFQDCPALQKVGLEFPLSESWEWDTDPNFAADTPEDEKKFLEVWNNGIIALTDAENSGGQTWFLVVSGPRRGEVWERDESGVLRLSGCTFWDWIELCLSEKLMPYVDQLFMQEKQQREAGDPLLKIRTLMRDQRRQNIRWNPPASMEAVRNFERRHGVELPKEYVTFITEIADGCCNYPATNSKGKGGIMFSLKELDSVQYMDKAFQFQEINDEAFRAMLFRHDREHTVWQTVLAAYPQEDPISSVWSSPDYSALCGVLPFGFNQDTGPFGSNTQVFLVLNGPSKGQVWKARKFKIQPASFDDTFYDWVIHMLENGDI